MRTGRVLGVSKSRQPASVDLGMREGGLEPPCLSAPDPKSGASANFATLARAGLVSPFLAKSTCSCKVDLTLRADWLAQEAHVGYGSFRSGRGILLKSRPQFARPSIAR